MPGMGRIPGTFPMSVASDGSPDSDAPDYEPDHDAPDYEPDAYWVTALGTPTPGTGTAHCTGPN